MPAACCRAQPRPSAVLVRDVAPVAAELPAAEADRADRRTAPGYRSSRSCIRATQATSASYFLRNLRPTPVRLPAHHDPLVGRDHEIVLQVTAGAASTAALAAGASGPADAAVQVSQSGWQWGNPTPQGNTIRALDFNAGRGYAVGDAGTALRTDDGGATWVGPGDRHVAGLDRVTP